MYEATGLYPAIAVVHAGLVEASEGLRCSHRLLVHVVVVEEERLVKKVESLLGWLSGEREARGLSHKLQFLGCMLNLFGVDLVCVLVFIVGWRKCFFKLQTLSKASLLCLSSRAIGLAVKAHSNKLFFALDFLLLLGSRCIKLLNREKVGSRWATQLAR
jgi:hypothetical protein